MATNLAASRLKVAVIGAGPIGLCTAAALKQQGHNVTVFERRRDTEPRGHALVIQPGAVRALGHLRGAHEAFQRFSVESGPLCLWSYKGNSIVRTPQPPPEHELPQYERRFQIDRPSVQRVFERLAADNGVEMRFGQAIHKVEDSSKTATLITADGQTHDADLIIAADGIKSATRKQLFPDRNVDPIPLRESIFLTSCRFSDLAKDPRVASWLEIGTKHAILGPERFLLTRHVYGQSLSVQFMDVNHADPGPVDGNWNTPADLDALRERFSDFDPVTRAYLDNIDHAEQWQMAMGPLLPTWRSENGRIVLAGDAAHAMLPHGAQGLSQGIEDAISLAQMLRATAAIKDLRSGVPAITAAWVDLRKPRCELFMKHSDENARLWSLPDGAEQEARDEKLAKTRDGPPKDLSKAEMDMHADRFSPQFLRWVRDYDVVHEAESALSKITADMSA